MFTYLGTSPSPSIATRGLRKSVECSDADVRYFVTRNFYVDDGLTSGQTADQSNEENNANLA